MQTKLVRYIAEIIEEMSENVEENGLILESITRKTEMMKFFTREVFSELVSSYRENFLLEEFLRKMHNAR